MAHGEHHFPQCKLHLCSFASSWHMANTISHNASFICVVLPRLVLCVCFLKMSRCDWTVCACARVCVCVCACARVFQGLYGSGRCRVRSRPSRWAVQQRRWVRCFPQEDDAGLPLQTQPLGNAAIGNSGRLATVLTHISNERWFIIL